MALEAFSINMSLKSVHLRLIHRFIDSFTCPHVHTGLGGDREVPAVPRGSVQHQGGHPGERPASFLRKGAILPWPAKEETRLPNGLHHSYRLPARSGIVATEDATCVQLLRQADAIPLCVTNVAQLGVWWNS